MGYAISVPIRDKKKRRKVLAWVRANMTPWPKLYKANEFDEVEMVENDVYARKGTIGFHYTAGCFYSREQAWVICEWLTTKVGDRIDGIPWIDYDHHEKIKIIKSKKFVQGTNGITVVNEDGIYWGLMRAPKPAGMKLMWILSRKRRMILIKELKRLNKLWNKEPPV